MYVAVLISFCLFEQTFSRHFYVVHCACDGAGNLPDSGDQVLSLRPYRTRAHLRVTYYRMYLLIFITAFNCMLLLTYQYNPCLYLFFS